MKCVILHYKNKPIYLCELKEVDGAKAVQIKKECEANLKELEKELKEKAEKTESEIQLLWEAVKFLKGEDE